MSFWSLVRFAQIAINAPVPNCPFFGCSILSKTMITLAKFNRNYFLK